MLFAQTNVIKVCIFRVVVSFFFSFASVSLLFLWLNWFYLQQTNYEAGHESLKLFSELWKMVASIFSWKFRVWVFLYLFWKTFQLNFFRYLCGWGCDVDSSQHALHFEIDSVIFQIQQITTIMATSTSINQEPKYPSSEKG